MKLSLSEYFGFTDDEIIAAFKEEGISMTSADVKELVRDFRVESATMQPLSQ